MSRPFVPLTLLFCFGLALPAQVLSPPPPVATVPADLPIGERWLRHFREDLLPFWNVPAAWGTPRGNFPTFRGNDGRAVDWAKPSETAVSRKAWANAG